MLVGPLCQLWEDRRERMGGGRRGGCKSGLLFQFLLLNEKDKRLRQLENESRYDDLGNEETI